MISNISKADIFFMVSAAVFMQILGMFTPYVTSVVYNILIPSGSDSLIFPVASLMVGVTLGSLILGVSNKIVTNRFQGRLILTVNSAIMIRLFSLPTTFFKNYTAGELASRMGYISVLCQKIVSAVLATALPAMFSLGYLFQMYQYAPSLVIPGIVIVIVNIIYLVLITLLRQGIYKKKLDISPKLQGLKRRRDRRSERNYRKA